jgi:carbonic anhydrase
LLNHSTIMIKSGFFRAEIERSVKIGAVAMALSVFLGTFAWGYEQRRQAQTWRDLACTYRLADVGRRATFLAVDEQTPEACGRLNELGLSVGREVVSAPDTSITARP